MHPRGLVNKMTKIFFFYVSADKIAFFYGFGEKKFRVLRKNVCFDEKVYFCGFFEKYVFAGLAENTFCSFCGKNVFFAVLAENVCFDEKCIFAG